jgi:replicative DNA helicase
MSKSPQLRIPPQSLDSEKALLGSIMLRPEVMHEIIDTVSEDSFYAEKHKIIFRGMFALFSKSEPIDLVSLSGKLTETNVIERTGGMSYLAELVEMVPSAANAKYYAEIVQKKYVMRQLIEAANYISDLGFKEEREIDEILDDAERKMYEITNAPTNKKFAALSDILGIAFERLDTLHKSDGTLRGVPSGFKELDDKTAGFQQSDLIILAGRPSTGKTALALDIARRSAIQHGTSVGIFSLEMSDQQLVDRMLAAEAGVDSWRLRTGKLRTDQEFEQIQGALDRLSKANIYIDDQPANTILTMRSVARRLKSEKGLDLIIVDYLQLMAPTKSRGSDSMVQQVTEISRSLKQLARELKVPVIALSQLSRAIEQRRGKPQLSDLRDSGSIEQDADMVCFLHNPDRYKDEGERGNVIQLLIEKHRNGPTGMLEFYFDAKKATFRAIAPSGVATGYENQVADVDDF